MGAAFPGFLVPLRFNYNAKFQHYLDIYNAVATGGQCEILGKPGMENMALQILTMLLQMFVLII